MKKTGMHRRTTICVIALIVLLLMGGCAGMDQLQNQIEQSLNDNKDIFLAHMEEKYDVCFLPISYTSEGAVVNEEFRCYAEGTDRERDYVRVFRKLEDGEEVFYDDYFGIMIRDEYQSRVQDICNTVVGEAKAYVDRYTAASFDNSLAAGSTLDDAIAMGELINASKYIFFEVAPGSEEAFEDTCDKIAEKLARSQLPGLVKFIGLAEGELKKITVDTYRTHIPSMVKPDGVICLMMSSTAVTLN